MSDGDALLRAILDNPDDDAPRYVYADWLDENGQPERAEFIRAQLQLARLPADHPDRPRLARTERRLVRTHRKEWNAWLPWWAREREFHRGFVEVVGCFLAEYLAGADVLRGRTPLAGVRLTSPGDLLVPLFRSRTLDGLRTLTLRVPSEGLIPGEAWELLAECPYLGRLTELELTSNGTAGPAMVNALLSSTSLPALRTLRVRWFRLGDEDVARLVNHPWVRRLTTLDLGGNLIGEDGYRALVASPHLDGLTLLDLRGNQVSGLAGPLLRQRFGDRLRLLPDPYSRRR
jgi:uncharacterized protein (TIGR02996 family)